MNALISRFACVVLLLAMLVPSFAFAASPFGEAKFPKTKAAIQSPQQDSFVLTSDTVSYDENLGIITASGHVEIVQEPNILMADTVSYNEKTSSVTASGNVSLMQPNGDVAFSDYTELTDGLKDGFVKNIRLLLSDNSRMAALSAKHDEKFTTLEKVVYSPCDLCKSDPRNAPLWQIKAAEAVHDKEEQKIKYYDMTMEFDGVPVFYTPYFAHADPGVKQKDGFFEFFCFDIQRSRCFCAQLLLFGSRA